MWRNRSAVSVTYEGLVLVTRDRNVRRYDVAVMRA